MLSQPGPLSFRACGCLSHAAHSPLYSALPDGCTATSPFLKTGWRAEQSRRPCRAAAHWLPAALHPLTFLCRMIWRV